MNNLFFYLPVLICSLIFYLFGVEFINFIFFTTIYIWPFAMEKIGRKDEKWHDTYRLSMIRNLYKFDRRIKYFILNNRIKYILRVNEYVFPFLICFILKIITFSGSFFIILLSVAVAKLAKEKFFHKFYN